MGIEILDIQLKRINYTRQVQDQVFNRMISGQNQIAEKYRAQGQGKKQEILGMQVQRKKEIMSEAYYEAQKIKGDADAEVTSVYANATSTTASTAESSNGTASGTANATTN